MILELIPEIYEYIFSLSKTADLKRLACCNSTYNRILKEILWESIKLTHKNLREEDVNGHNNRSKLANLRLTKTLIFSDDQYSIIIDEKKEQRICNNYRHILTKCRPYSLKICFYIPRPLLSLVGRLRHHLIELNLSGTDLDSSTLRYLCKHLVSLKILDISGTSVGDGGFVFLSQKLRSLKELTICNLPITHQGIVYIKDLSLDKLSASKCKSFDLNTLFGSLQVNVEHLDISGCTFPDRGDENFPRLSSLRTLYVRNCTNISDEWCLTLSTLESLTELDISENGTSLSDVALLALGEMPNLEKLSLRGCIEISDRGLESLTSLAHLTLLDIGQCPITSEGLSQVAMLRELKNLNLNFCDKITDIGCLYIATLSFLQQLDLGNCCITDEGVKNLSTLNTLQKLSLKRCLNLTDVGMVEVAKLSKLKDLDVSFCHHVGDDGVSALRSLLLLSLDISSTSVTDLGVKILLPSLVFLTNLNVARTDITKECLDDICQLRCLEVLDITYTRIMSDAVFSDDHSFRLLRVLKM